MSDSSPSFDLSVALCTWNPAPLIEDTVQSLACQSLGRERYEILIIDNGSDSERAALIKRLCDQHGCRYVLESEVGLSSARNCAIRAAAGRYLYFIDDDAVAPAHLLETVLRCFADSDCDVVGGPAHGLWADTPPRWLGSRYWRMLSLVSYGPVRRPLRYPEIPLGCNIAFHQRVFERYGDFRVDLGRKGGSLIGHEERELLHRIMTAGGQVLYEPRAYVFHAVSMERMQVDYFKRRTIASSISSQLMSGAVRSSNPLKRLGHFAYGQLKTAYHAFIFAVELYVFETTLQISAERRRDRR